jgi:hypothetical protein
MKSKSGSSAPPIPVGDKWTSRAGGVTENASVRENSRLL